MRNWERWRSMTPGERKEMRERMRHERPRGERTPAPPPSR
jgi:hypothetical protein